MGRAPCCDKASMNKGPWSPEEDAKLKSYIDHHGTAGNWIALPQKIGLKRCSKTCRLRWLNYLRPDIKHGGFSEEEDEVICSLYVAIGSRWSIIASQLPGRTDNDIKNYWNTKLKKKLFGKQRKERRQAWGGSGTRSELESYSTFSRFLPPKDQAIVGHNSPDQNIFRRLFCGHPSMGIVSIDSAGCGADHRLVDQLHANFVGSVDAFSVGQFPLLQRCEEAALDLEDLLCGNSTSPEVADGGVNSFVSRGSSYSSLVSINWNDQANPLIDHQDLPLPSGFLGEEEEPALPHFGVSLS